MKAIRVDVINKCVEMIDVEPGLQAVYDTLDCQFIVKVPMTDPQITDCFYVDEAACLKEFKDIPGACWTTLVDSGKMPFFGHALVVGIDPVANVRKDCTLTVEQVADSVRFLSREEAEKFYNLFNNPTPLNIIEF